MIILEAHILVFLAHRPVRPPQFTVPLLGMTSPLRNQQELPLSWIRESPWLSYRLWCWLFSVWTLCNQARLIPSDYFPPRGLQSATHGHPTAGGKYSRKGHFQSDRWEAKPSVGLLSFPEKPTSGTLFHLHRDKGNGTWASLGSLAHCFHIFMTTHPLKTSFLI